MSAKKQKVSAEERIFLFSSESVNEGHPDKLADQVSDAVLDACLTEDPMSKVRSRRGAVQRAGRAGARAVPVSADATASPRRAAAAAAAALTAHPCPGRSRARRRPRTTW